jgi:hypothetical protein
MISSLYTHLLRKKEQQLLKRHNRNKPLDPKELNKLELLERTASALHGANMLAPSPAPVLPANAPCCPDVEPGSVFSSKTGESQLAPMTRYQAGKLAFTLGLHIWS